VDGAKKLLKMRRGNAEDWAYVEIRQMIFNSSLPAGDRIVPEQLARRLKLSRTPVSTALKRLVQDSLVEWFPRRGMYVRRPSKAELVLIFELREVLEGLAARRAALRITSDELDELEVLFADVVDDESIQNRALYLRQDFIFHKRLIEIADSPRLGDTLKSVRIMASAFAGGVIRTVAEGMAEHRRILEAMRRGDSEAAENAMRLHLKKSAQKLADEAELEAVSINLSMTSVVRDTAALTPAPDR
jgi:GntR family transcriptional regulator, vanillate catabolism transcriptional regulator